MTNERAPHGTVLGQYAGFATRAVAFVIDWLILIVSILFTGIFASFLVQTALTELQVSSVDWGRLIWTTMVPALFALLPAVYMIGFWLIAGQTPGKWVMGVRVVRTDGERAHFGNCVLRWIGYWFSGILLLGYLWILVDNKRQGFHDKLAGTLVVYAWPEAQQGTSIQDRMRSLKKRVFAS